MKPYHFVSVLVLVAVSLPVVLWSFSCLFVLYDLTIRLASRPKMDSSRRFSILLHVSPFSPPTRRQRYQAHATR
ncbi:hypothetical protein QBC44DRAFT_320949 [Cladorrhinum sp. PSN332]|nr:hypothetical protein QBC44DRAFT_320949 [Cladorrhinum sp. PSN332]